MWLYARFTLSLRDVEDLLAERGITVSYETIRVWVARFGPQTARYLRRQRGRPSDTWHLDEMFVRIRGRWMYLWRAVDAEDEILDVLVQSKRDKHAALRLMRKLLKKQVNLVPCPRGFPTTSDLTNSGSRAVGRSGPGFRQLPI